MFSVTGNTRAVLAVLLSSAALVSAAQGATMDDVLLVDPTRPLTGFADADGSEASVNAESVLDVFGIFTRYQLNSVLIRSDDRIAVINDERVRVGDQIGSAVVASIESDHVTLNVDGEIQSLPLYEDSIKTLVKGDE